MPHALIPRSELSFLLFDWLRVDQWPQRPDRAEHDRTTFEAMLDLAEQIAGDAFLPAYKIADQHEPELRDGIVVTSPAICRAIAEYRSAGLFAAGFPEQFGGSDFPFVICMAAYAQFAAANIAAAAFPMLTNANARLLLTYASEAQIEQFARPVIAGDWLGTMCLSEPQAGSSLGDITTLAKADGSDALGERFLLYGNKMWISGGDQDVSENIIHLVLAKVVTEGQPPALATRGLSLFIVPKILPDGRANDIQVAGLNHKMGYRGIPNCLLSFGGDAGAVGWRVGEAGQGLKQMFMMMNEARISVGLGAGAVAFRAHLLSCRYATERSQGRPAAMGAGASVPIVHHPDVREMLLAQKSYVEGALALCLFCASLADDAVDQDDRALLGLLTPVAKTWPSEWGLAANDLAIQIHGGYGYTRDFDVEQLYRDNRLNPIHEGTTGIQAIDLVERKLRKDEGAAYDVLRSRTRATCAAAEGIVPPAIAAAVEDVWTHLDAAVNRLRTDSEALALANATSMLRAFGHAVVGWLWLDLLIAAHRDEHPLLEPKLAACRYFVERELPKVDLFLRPIMGSSDLTLSLPETIFAV